MWLNPLFTCFIFLTFAGTAHCLTCHTGSSTGKLKTPTTKASCTTRCYVEYDKYSNWKKNTWQIGCMDSTELNKCGTSGKTDAGSSKAYCCCDSDECNNYNFGFYCYTEQHSSGLSAFMTTCNKGSKTGSQNPVAPTGVGKERGCIGQCYVEIRDYKEESYDRWTYGCLQRGYLKNCGEKAVTKGTYKRTSCCCEGPKCNTLAFAQDCAPDATVNPNPVVVASKPPPVTPVPVNPVIVNPVPVGFKCKAGSTTVGKLTAPNRNDVQCNGKCYVMMTDYDNSDKYSWTYGCLTNSQKSLCGTPYDGGSFTNHYCCCDGERCNDRDFADEYCSSSVIYRISILAFLPIALFMFYLNN